MTPTQTPVRAVVIGSSAGGLQALSRCLSPLPKSFSLPIFVAQHVHPRGPRYGAEVLSNKCNLVVREANDKEIICRGIVYLAPANYHLMVEDEETLVLSVYEKVNFARPSVDVLFESASDVFQSRLVGVLLTGANNDGANGLRYIKKNGGIAVVQDPRTAEYDAMPKSALAATSVDHILNLDEIGRFLISLDAHSSQEVGPV